LTDLGEEQPRIGKPACTCQGVEMVTHKIREDGDERGMLIYGYKLRPVLQRN
jgi:hypothetical protein